MCSRWTLPESTQKLLGQSWKLVYIFGIYLVFLLFCYTECSTKSERQSNRSWTWFSFKKNEKKKEEKKTSWIRHFFARKIIYEWCHRCIYTIKQNKKLIGHCYLSVYKIYSSHHFLNGIHNEPQQRNYESQEQPLCNEIPINFMIFIFSFISSHCYILTIYIYI